MAKDKNPIFSIPSIAKMQGITNAAVWQSVRKGRLKAFKEGGRYYVTLKDYKEYINKRYQRIDPPGYMSIKNVAKFCGIKAETVYFWIYRGRAVPKKINGLLVIDNAQCEKLKLLCDVRHER